MAKAAPRESIPKRALEQYDAMIALCPGVERKGAKNPYTSAGGSMTTFLTDEGKLAMRLPPDELAEFIVKHRTDHPFVYKTVMKDFAIIPPKIFKDAKEAAKLLQRSDAAAAAGKVGKSRKKVAKKTAKKTAKKKTAKKKTAKKKTAKKKTAKKKTAKKKTAKKKTARRAR